MARRDSKEEYAPGVCIDWESTDTVMYSGRREALIGCGLVQPDWLPGEVGCGKTSQSVLLLEAGTGKLLPPKSQSKKFDEGFGSISTWKSGGLFRVRKWLAIEERERRSAERQAATTQGTWNTAKAAHRQDYPERWTDNVMQLVLKIERLIEGDLVFTDYPEMSLPASGVRAAKKTIEELRNVLQWAAPQINDVTLTSNVVSLKSAAFRYMRTG